MAGSTHLPGKIFTQTGEFDPDILCEKHERQLGPLDDYAVRFVRNWRSVGRPFWPGILLFEDVDSEKLVRFAASVIWRFGVSKRYPSTRLGTYEPTLREAVFGQASVDEDPALLITGFQEDMFSASTLDKICCPPTYSIIPDRNGQGFIVGGLLFNLITDSRPCPSTVRAVTVNGKTDIYVGLKPLRGSTEIEGIAGVLASMLKPRKA